MFLMFSSLYVTNNTIIGFLPTLIRYLVIAILLQSPLARFRPQRVLYTTNLMKSLNDIDKFRASTGVERSNEAINIYMNAKVVRRAEKTATGWYHLSNKEEQEIEDDVIYAGGKAEEIDVVV